MAAAVHLISTGDLLNAVLISVRRILLGFGFAAAVAVPVGLAMGLLPSVESSLDPVVQPLRSIAPIALVPLAILWFNSGTNTAVFIVFYSAFFPILINTIAGVKGVSMQFIRAARVQGVSELTILRTIIIPAALPTLFVGLRLGMGESWAAIIAAELAVGARTGTSGGIGQMMFLFFAYNVDPNAIIVCMITIGLIGFVIDRGLRNLQRLLMPWV